MYDQAERFDAHIQLDEEFVAVLDVAEAIALSFGILRGMHHCTSAARGVCRVHPGWVRVLLGSVRSSQPLGAQDDRDLDHPQS